MPPGANRGGETTHPSMSLRNKGMDLILRFET